jgi:hypothetical protein
MTIIDPKFTISQDILNKCLTFAKSSVNTSTDKYARRNQFDGEKIIKDIRNGKVGEEAVWEKYAIDFPNLSKPDHQIYDKKDKSWTADLVDKVSNIRLAVKSQDIDSSIHFGESWVFQFGNGGKYDCDTGVFKTTDDNHYVAFVALNTPKKTGLIRAVVKVQWLHDKKLFKAMQKQSLRGNKVAVYYDDLEKYSNELWQL